MKLKTLLLSVQRNLIQSARTQVVPTMCKTDTVYLTGLMFFIILCAVSWVSAVTQQWIWFPEGSPQKEAPAAVRFFRKSVNISTGVVKAYLTVAVDNKYEITVNSKVLGWGDNWSQPKEYDLTKLLVKGKNLITLKARNIDGAAGILTEGMIYFTDGKSERLTTDGTWRTASQEHKDWTTLKFDDSKWQKVMVLGTAPMSPWDKFTIPVKGKLRLDPLTPLMEKLESQMNTLKDVPKPDLQGIDQEFVNLKTQFTELQKLTPDKVQESEIDTIEKSIPTFTQRIDTILYASFMKKTKLEVKKKTVNIQSIKQVFPVGVWFDGRVYGINVPQGSANVPAGEKDARGYYKQCFTEIKKHNLDYLVVPNTPVLTPDKKENYRKFLLEETDKLGLKVILEPSELTALITDPAKQTNWDEIYKTILNTEKELGKFKSLSYYLLTDNLKPEHVPGVKAATRILELLTPARIGVTTFKIKDVHLKSELDPMVLVIQLNSLGVNTLYGDQVVADWNKAISNPKAIDAMQSERIRWIVIPVYGKPGVYRIPTQTEIRAMTYLSILSNAQGIFYYLYNSNSQEDHLIGLDQDKANLTEVGKLAAELKKLTPILVKCKPVDSICTLQSTDKLQTQTLVDDKKTKYVLILNLNVEKEQTVTFDLIPEPKKKIGKATDLRTGKPIPKPQIGNDKTTFTTTIAAGDGLVLKVE